MRPVHFYHFHADGRWRRPASEHFRALSAAGFDGAVLVGMVGSALSRQQATAWLAAYAPGARVCAEADFGYEQVTIDVIRSGVLDLSPDTPVLYAHTKGAFRAVHVNDHWRWGMTSALVTDWQSCVPLLESVDAVGLHWLTPGNDYPEAVTSPVFAGNFWWATAGYLKTLPPPGRASRYDAERWLGLGGPRVRDLSPGWPPYPLSLPPDCGCPEP